MCIRDRHNADRRAAVGAHRGQRKCRGFENTLAGGEVQVVVKAGDELREVDHDACICGWAEDRGFSRTRARNIAPATNSTVSASMERRGLPVRLDTAPMRTGPMTAENRPTVLSVSYTHL